ncbi:MAG: 1-deoxy-D-xylulose-5-phosphate reductoisomerase [Muribaculaceae bacterium]|nr:1-deoxy-D-xylulose-5-phosphate reductoisomerase [Muribaculaceae bacterium]
MEKKVKNIAILGSTGSIGTQTLDIIAEYPDRFHASVLTARRNWRLLAEQAKKFHPSKVVISDPSAYSSLKEALAGFDVEVLLGADEIAHCAALPEVDIVVTAMVGYSGLIPTISAINAGKIIALANKETLVVAGELITGMLKNSESSIIPVDSEHSAIFQCLVGEKTKEARKILLTASGGPFRKLSKEQLRDVSVKDALNHPNWSMGAKVTIDSASMMNKGFEMIEARWLFNCPPKNIEIVVHPQSIVHSMVEFVDGSIKAQLGVPDMHLPIRYALGYPERLPTDTPPLSLAQYATLTFEAPDYDKFPLLGFAFEAIEEGGNMPCILNAANEKGVAAFLEGRIRFTDMPLLVADVMKTTTFIPHPSLDDLILTNTEALKRADDWLAHNS